MSKLQGTRAARRGEGKRNEDYVARLLSVGKTQEEAEDYCLDIALTHMSKILAALVVELDKGHTEDELLTLIGEVEKNTHGEGPISVQNCVTNWRAALAAYNRHHPRRIH